MSEIAQVVTTKGDPELHEILHSVYSSTELDSMFVKIKICNKNHYLGHFLQKVIWSFIKKVKPVDRGASQSTRIRFLIHFWE